MLGSQFRITGLDSPAEAAELALLLRAGALAAPMYFVEERTVGPSPGKENIEAGSVLGIGALKNIELRYFDPETKKYHDYPLGETSYEAAPVCGNVSFFDNDVYLHLHANVSGPDFKSWAGHLKSAFVSATFEVILNLAPGTANRKFSEEIGLNLLDLK